MNRTMKNETWALWINYSPPANLWVECIYTFYDSLNWIIYVRWTKTTKQIASWLGALGRSYGHVLVLRSRQESLMRIGRRLKQKRDGISCCIVHHFSKPVSWQKMTKAFTRLNIVWSGRISFQSKITACSLSEKKKLSWRAVSVQLWWSHPNLNSEYEVVDSFHNIDALPEGKNNKIKPLKPLMIKIDESRH